MAMGTQACRFFFFIKCHGQALDFPKVTHQKTGCDSSRETSGQNGTHPKADFAFLYFTNKPKITGIEEFTLGKDSAVGFKNPILNVQQRNAPSRLRLAPLSPSPSCLTRKKTARKKWPREISPKGEYSRGHFFSQFSVASRTTD